MFANLLPHEPATSRDTPTLRPQDAELFTVRGAGGVRLSAYELVDRSGGAGARPALVFGHANGFNAGCYGPFLARLAQRYRVFAFDSRGHGASQALPLVPAENYAFELLAKDLCAMAAAVQGRIGVGVPLHFVSHSMNGAAALTAAAAGELPVFASMTMFEPPVYPLPDHAVRAEADKSNKLFVSWSARRPSRFASWADYGAELDAIAPYGEFTDEMRLAHMAATVYLEDDCLRLRCDGAVESLIYGSAPKAQCFEGGAYVQCPARIYIADGALSPRPYWQSTVLEELAASMPKGDARVMTGYHHLMVQENPDLCAQAVTEMIDANS